MLTLTLKPTTPFGDHDGRDETAIETAGHRDGNIGDQTMAKIKMAFTIARAATAEQKQSDE